jgi:hypothetical protein
MVPGVVRSGAAHLRGRAGSDEGTGLRQPEVEELRGQRRGRPAAGNEEDVARLQITVHDAGVVSPLERGSDLHSVLKRVG